MAPDTALVTAAQLAQGIEHDGWRVVDCRFDLMDPTAGRRGYEAGHLPGAVYMHLDEDLSGPRDERSGRHPLPHPATLATRLGELGIGNDTPVVAYDAGPGSYAARLWWLLRWLGHRRVADVPPLLSSRSV